MRLIVGFIVLTAALSLQSRAAFSQAPKTPPEAGFVFHDENSFGGFTVQRWVSQEAPEVSPSGVCECITLVYAGEKKILSVGGRQGIDAIAIDPLSGQDINADGFPELIVRSWSGGAHCCQTTSIYSVADQASLILSINTGNCLGQFEDLDKDGKLEFVTCDDGWAYEYCSFASSPMPTVVLAFDVDRKRYFPATPKYANHFAERVVEATKQAEDALAASDRTLETDRCSVLQPVLELMYVGRFDEGVALLRRLYHHPDALEFERQTVEKVKSRNLWVAPERKH
jgi:hypothetical protein